jgi:hypothetical protein
MDIAIYNFIILQGETTQLSFQLVGDDETPVDLSGYSVRMQIRPDYADFSSEVFVSLDSEIDEDGSYIRIESEGILSFQISATQTSSINDDRCKYDIELYDETGYVKRILEGKISIRREVTR